MSDQFTLDPETMEGPIRKSDPGGSTHERLGGYRPLPVVPEPEPPKHVCAKCKYYWSSGHHHECLTALLTTDYVTGWQDHAQCRERNKDGTCLDWELKPKRRRWWLLWLA